MSQVSPIEKPMTETSVLATYLAEAAEAGVTLHPGFVAYLAALEQISTVSPEVAKSIVTELTSETISK